MLTCGTAKHAPELSNQGTPHPQGAGLIKEISHLRGHVAKACGRAEHDCVVLLQLIGCGNGRRLIEPKTRRYAYLLRHQLCNTLDDNSAPIHTRNPLGLCCRHLFDVSVAAVVKDEDVGHGSAPGFRIAKLISLS